MEIHALLGILSPCVAALGYIPYVYSMYKGVVKPHPFSWLPWSIMGLITLIAYVGVGAKETLPLAVLNFFGPTLIFLFTLKFGYKNFARFDYHCLYFSLAAIAVYVIFRNAVFALAVNLIGDLVAHFPTIRKAYQDPASENRITWLCFLFGNSLSLIAITSWNFGVAVFPIFLTGSALAVLTALFLGRLR